MDRMIEAVAERFRSDGFDAHLELSDGPDGRLTLIRGGTQRTFLLRIRRPLTLNVDPYGGPDLLYVTDRISPKSAESLRRLGVNWADTDGNAYISGDGWHIDIRGRGRRGIGPDHSTGQAPLNLYSARRAQVIFALLTWPGLLDASLRTVAAAAGVSIGIAQSTNQELHRRALWPNRSESRDALIDGWASAFPETLARSLTLRAVRADHLASFYGPVLRSGEIAPSAQMRPTSGVVYVDELTTELLMQNRWRTDGTPNLVVRRRFWSIEDADESDEVPPLLVYGDLHASDDPRARSVAAQYRVRL